MIDVDLNSHILCRNSLIQQQRLERCLIHSQYRLFGEHLQVLKMPSLYAKSKVCRSLPLSTSQCYLLRVQHAILYWLHQPLLILGGPFLKYHSPQKDKTGKLFEHTWTRIIQLKNFSRTVYPPIEQLLECAWTYVQSNHSILSDWATFNNCVWFDWTSVYHPIERLCIVWLNNCISSDWTIVHHPIEKLFFSAVFTENLHIYRIPPPYLSSQQLMVCNDGLHLYTLYLFHVHLCILCKQTIVQYTLWM